MDREPSAAAENPSAFRLLQQQNEVTISRIWEALTLEVAGDAAPR